MQWSRSYLTANAFALGAVVLLAGATHAAPIYINFAQANDTAAGWNLIYGTNISSNNLIDSTETATSVSLVTSGVVDADGGGPLASSASAPVTEATGAGPGTNLPYNVRTGLIYVSGAGDYRFTLTGLVPSEKYSLDFFNGYNPGASRDDSKFIVAGLTTQTNTINPVQNNNFLNFITAANASGELVVTMSEMSPDGVGTSAAYISALMIDKLPSGTVISIK
ncbi:MAG: hypothetical protein JXB13_12920 [Phycisphaerae bacterium]|nr:hypothetical protein [Phycisphaerae bacterium]